MYLINNFLSYYIIFSYFITVAVGLFSCHLPRKIISELCQVCCAIKFLHKKCVFLGEERKFFPTKQALFVRKHNFNALKSYFIEL